MRVETRCTAAEQVEGLSPATVRRWRVAIRSFVRHLRRIGAEGFLRGDVRAQTAAIESWIAALRTEKRERTTIAAYFEAALSIFRRLEESDATLNPFDFLPRPRAPLPQPRCLTASEVDRVFATVRSLAAHPFERARNVALIAIYVFAGLRRGEALRLEMADVDLERGRLLVRRGKGRHGGRDRTAYITPQLAAFLRTYLAVRGQRRVLSVALFVSTWRDQPMPLVAVTRLFRRISASAGFLVTPHMLRHSYATFLRQAGVPDRVSMDLLGHRSLAMLQRYSHVFDGEHAAYAARLYLPLGGIERQEP